MSKVVWCEEHCNNLNNFFFHYKKRLWNGEVPWMLKVLHGTINANKEPLCLKGYLYWKIVFCTKKKIYILRTVHWNILYGIQNGSSMASPLWNFICKSVRADISIIVQHLMPYCLGLLDKRTCGPSGTSFSDAACGTRVQVEEHRLSDAVLGGKLKPREDESEDEWARGHGCHLAIPPVDFLHEEN